MLYYCIAYRLCSKDVMSRKHVADMTSKAMGTFLEAYRRDKAGHRLPGCSHRVIASYLLVGTDRHTLQSSIHSATTSVTPLCLLCSRQAEFSTDLSRG